MRAIAVLLLLLTSLGAAKADQDDPRLPPLFDVLAEAPNLHQAQKVESIIWSLWLAHEDELVMQMMRISANAIGEGLMEEALLQADQVVDRAPDYAEGWNRRATIYYMLDRYDESLADIDRVLALEPRHFGALSGRGLCLMALGRLEEAEAAFVSALAIHPQMPGARRNLEYIEDQLGNPI